MALLKEGDKVPAFSVPDEEGKTVSSGDLLGKKYVIYFYPKDDTPGCTKEACSIRDDFSQFRNLNVPVFGVSKDSAASHQKFIQKYKLPFHLLVDQDAKLATSFGAYDKKSLFGRIGFGIIRSTFIVNEKGIIEKAFPKVKVSEHARELLEALLV